MKHRMKARHRSSRLSFFAGLCALLAGAPLVQAQVSGSISGRVEDATGAVVSGATITVKNVETGATRVATTDAAGAFRIPSLPLGLQEVKAEKTGFKAGVRTGIDLAVGQEAVVNLRLEVGELSQQVLVYAEAPLINTTTSSVSGLVEERQVKELPLNGRSFDNLITLNPGAINYALKSANTSSSNGNTFSVSGRRPMDNLVLLNGIEYMGSSQLAVTPGGVSGDLLGIDAVREFNVLTETYSAEYGKRAGAQVTVVTQSGGNAVHGSMFEFLRNSAVDARSFLDVIVKPGADHADVPPFRRNQFGGALGGPLKKDKLFLFGNYEGFRQSLAVSSVSVVPDAQARLGILPPNVISGPFTLNRAMLPYAQSFWPAPNGPELLGGGLPSGTALSYNNPKQSIHEDFGTLRTDYLARDRDSISGSYTIDDGHNLIPLADPIFGSANRLRMQVASLQETHIVSPRMLNTFRAGYSRAAFNLDAAVLSPLPEGTSFVTGAAPGGIIVGGGLTTTAAGTITSAGPNNAAAVWNRRNLYSLTDGVQFNAGIHQMSFGVWFQRLQDNEDSASPQLGSATFSTLQTFLQGTVSNFQVVSSATELGWRSLFGAWYFQDTIKLRPNLTLQAGIRHEFTTGWNEVNGRGANYVTDSSGVLVTATRVADSVFTENNATRLFSPRVALAWDPFGNGKTAVRAGFGTYYSLIDNLAFMLNYLPPYNGTASFANRSLFTIIPVAPVPAPANTIFAPRGIQPNADTPVVQEWNFTVEQQITSGTALRLAYVGSRGYHGLLTIDPNTIPARVCASATCPAGGNGATQSFVPQGTVYIPGIGTPRPNSNLGAGFFWYTEGNTSYQAFQVDLNRRLAHGLQFRTNYTFSKNLDMNSALTLAQSSNQAQMTMDRNNTRRDWGPSALNVANQFSVSAVYELPFGKGKPLLANAGGFVNKLAGGWQLNGITTLLSGFPFTPQIGSNRSGDGDTRNPDRPNLNPSFTGPVVTGSPNRWFNPAAFVLPTAGTYGGLGRGTYDGPGLASLDVSLLKNTFIAERINLQFRVEAFNLLNHSNFGTPNAIVFAGTNPSSSAGLITTAATFPRQIQFGLKLSF